MSPGPQAEFDQLIPLFNAGRYAEMEGKALLLIERYPDSGFAWKALGLSRRLQDKYALPALQKATELLPDDAEVRNTLGNVLKDLGQLRAAAASYRRAVEIKPDYTDAHYNLALALQDIGQLHDAVASYRRTLRIKPEYAEARNNLGNVLKDLGQLDGAVTSYRLALEIDPGLADAHYNLGVALQAVGQIDGAVASYRRTLDIFPEHAEAHSRLGIALAGLGQLDDAVASYRRTLAITPDSAEAHNNLGAALQAIGQLHDATASYRQALAIKPDFAEAHNNLGVALQDLRQLEGAVASCRRALEVDPDYAEARYNLGNALRELGLLEDALASYRRALEIKPDYAEACGNLGVALQDLRQLDDAATTYRRALEIKPDYAEAHSNLLLIHSYLSAQPAAMLLGEARRFGGQAARRARPLGTWRNVPDPARCLRVGLVSGDLREHSVGHFVDAVLAALAAKASGRLEFIAYSNHPCSDALTARIRASCHGWHSVARLPDEALAQLIRSDGIDILIDLAGHTAHNRLPLFAWKPAPVQVTWLGYLGTTGVAAMDYLVADPWTLPQSEEAHFTEEIWRLPQTYLCFTRPEADVQVASLPALTNGYITFGCFNNLNKMNDTVLALWARVLLAVPGSRLFLKAKQFGEAAVRQMVVNRFFAHGIDAGRLVLEGTVASRAEHLAAYNRVDIALDPFPYPGIATSVEGLWMGVPMLTLGGDRFLSRQGVGLLMNAGLPEWIAADPDDYLARAVSHTGDLQRLAALREGLRQQMLDSPLFDAPAFADHFEAALRGMWTRWCHQKQGRALSRVTTLVLVDGVRIVVPDTLDLITPYVLLEQQDWFEEEIRFLRRLLQPAQKVIDIGANYGVYTLSMANTVGPAGQVWAFEPASSTAALLAQGIAANGYSHVVLERSALSSSCGTARLSLNDDPELNALVRGGSTADAYETVPLVTLDACLERYDWRDIEFLKIDAEGEEANILKGGARFFAELSPLVQYEIRAGADLHMELVRDFAALGYGSYRLVPGLGLLVPFAAEATPDEYLLNLFCCKQDRADRLAAQGFLLPSAPRSPTTATATATARLKTIPENLQCRDRYDWRHTIAGFPYGAQLATVWEWTMSAGKGGGVEEALCLYAISRDSSRSSADRFAALEASYSLLRDLCEGQAPSLRLASLARVGRDYGARSLAVGSLNRLCESIFEHGRVDFSEPFLAPGARFDSLPPGEAIGNWMLASALDELERLGSFSSYYAGISARQRLEMIQALGFGSPEMARRLRLLQERFGLPSA